MKVLHLGRFLDENFGGLERVVVQLLDQLSKSIVVENLVCSRKNRWHSTVEEYHGWKVYQTASLGVAASTAISPVFPFRLHSLYRRHRYDVVHLHFPDPLSCISALMLPRSAKIVISWHSDVIKQKSVLRFYQPLVDALLKRTAAVVGATPSHFSDSTQMYALSQEKRHVIPYPVDADAFAFAPETQKRANEARARLGAEFVVFAVGRHVYYKGFDHLIAAIAALPRVHLVLGGDGPLMKDLQEYARETGAASRVHFTGRISEEDLRMYYHMCDVFCLSSIEKSEAFGMVQAEAMSCGKPVVCYDLNNGVTYVNRHMETGLVAPCGSVEGLAAAIEKLRVDEPLRRRLGAQALERIRREFSLDAMRGKMLSLYEEVTGAAAADRLSARAGV